MAQHVPTQHGTACSSTATAQRQHSTAQHSTAQHSTAQHSTAQHSTAQHSTAQHSTAQHSTEGLTDLHGAMLEGGLDHFFHCTGLKVGCMSRGAQLSLQSSNGSGSCGVHNLRDPVLLVGGLSLLRGVRPWPCNQTPMPVLRVARQRKQNLVTALVHMHTREAMQTIYTNPVQSNGWSSRSVDSSLQVGILKAVLYMYISKIATPGAALVPSRKAVRSISGPLPKTAALGSGRTAPTVGSYCPGPTLLAFSPVNRLPSGGGCGRNCPSGVSSYLSCAMSQLTPSAEPPTL